MARGIKITNGVSIPYARDDDYVVNTAFLGGMKVGEKKFFNPDKDFQLNSFGYRQLAYSHGLGYVPAVLAFYNGFLSVGWQNSSTIDTLSCSADARNVYMAIGNYPPDSVVCLIIFQEKVADA
jgi:hypothetical protein